MTKEQMVSKLGTISTNMDTLYSSAEEVAGYIYAADEYMEGNNMFGERYDKGVLKECFQKYCDICSTLNAIKSQADTVKAKLIRQIEQEAREKSAAASADASGTTSASGGNSGTKQPPNPKVVQRVLE